MTDVGGILWAGLIVGFAYGVRWLIRELLIWRPRAVYRINDKNGKILYIGSCYNVRTRMRRHWRERDTKSWWFGDASLHFQHTLVPDDVYWWRNTGLANTKETEAIRKEQPLGNTAGTDHPRRRKVVSGGD